MLSNFHRTVYRDPFFHRTDVDYMCVVMKDIKSPENIDFLLGYIIERLCDESSFEEGNTLIGEINAFVMKEVQNVYDNGGTAFNSLILTNRYIINKTINKFKNYKNNYYDPLWAEKGPGFSVQIKNWNRPGPGWPIQFNPLGEVVPLNRFYYSKAERYGLY